ncbi:UNVERIFIED_CONTAM: hypothetical protein FKN15_023776 [Acipenser sinensis]
MKLQAVMENLQRQQRAKLQLQLEQQQQLASQSQAQLSSSANPSTGREEPARGRPGGSPAPEEGSGEQSHTQMAALAAMRAAAAGLQRPPDSPLMEDSSEDEEEGGDEQYKDMMGSEEEEHIKKKWDEEDFEEEMEEDYDDELGEEGVGVMGGASIPGKEAPLHRQLHSHPQLLKAKGAGGQELQIQSLPSQGSLSQMPGQDHGDWTYEEQFKQTRSAAASELQRRRTTELWAAYRQSRRHPARPQGALVSRGHPGRPSPPSPQAKLSQLSTAPWELPSTVGCGIAWTRTGDIQAIERILHSSECF